MVKAHVCTEREFVGHIDENYSRRAAYVGTEGYGVSYGEYGLAKADHIVVYRRANDGCVALPRCVEQGDYF